MEHLAVVVLTWNNADYTLNCLQSLSEQTTRHTVYVVDNASTDGTPAAVMARFPAAHVIVNAENMGFAGGNNVGLSAAFADGADAALVLNNDTTLDPGALASLVAAAEAHPRAGIISPAILFARSPHRVWFAGAATNQWTGRITHQDYNAPYDAIARDIREIERATGCAMLITRGCYEQIGGFDASLFMYFEDIEYSLRARDAGFSILLAPAAVVYHHVSASSRGTKPPDAIYYGVRNGIVTMDRLRPLPMPFTVARRLLIVLAMLLYIARSPRAMARIRDIFDGYRDARRRQRGPRGAAPSGSPYGFNPDTRAAHARMLSLIPPGKRVLDVGCASGYLARLLRDRGYRVTGAEIDPAAAQEARAFCDTVYEISAEDLDRIPAEDEGYDAVIFGDVLEHLAHPDAALNGVHRLLAPNGAVVISLPNIVFFSARLKILLGRFDYTRDGLFDRTHLRFFTLRSANALFRECGFTVVTHDVTQASPLARVGTILRRRGLEDAAMTKLIDVCDLWLARRMPGLFAIQNLFVLRSARERAATPDDAPTSAEKHPTPHLATPAT